MKPEPTLRLGTSKVDITPAKPVPLAGFAIRSELGAFEDIAHRLFARILVFETSNGLDDREGHEEEKIILISADLLWWGSDRVPALKRRIHERFGVDEDAVMLHGTHTHSGPQTSGLFTSFLGVMDESYVAMLEERVMEGIEAAWNEGVPVRVERGIGSSSLGINRRGVSKSPPETGPVDHELTVIRFALVDGRTKALLVQYACHPVITRENVVSSEYVGVAMNIVEHMVGEGVIAAYLQGTCGDINPGDGEQVIRGNDEVVIQVGTVFANCVFETLHSPMRTLTPCRLESITMEVELPLSGLPEREQLEGTVLSPGLLGEWSRIMLERGDRRSTWVPLELSIWKLAEGLALLGMNAEVVVEYGLFIKRMTKGNVLPIGYTNGMFGYIPTAEQLLEGGYETHESTYYFAMASSFDESVEQVVKQALLKLLT